jgi:UDP-N-acetylglucosamine 2-epimerase (non-hydrolysing)
MKKILIIFGTRPEAIKLAPIIVKLREQRHIQSRVCVTAQHRQMLDQVLNLFAIEPDIDLNLMQPEQTLAEITSRVMMGIDQILLKENPDLILIQGDTTTVMTTALAAFYRGITVAHVEAGLRSGDSHSPFPEEVNRRIVSIVSSFHFAPTETAAIALRREGVPEKRIFLTGNPVIDALMMIVTKPVPFHAQQLIHAAGLNDDKSNNRKLILVTAHRRENFGPRFESICRGLKSLIERNLEVFIIYPVHLNPHVQEPVHRILGNTERVLLTHPVEYDVMVHLMNASYLVLTDSGGIQEEAPSLGKPVLVMRTETERPEGIEAGTARLVGPFENKIIEETERLLRDKVAYQQMAKAINPYGDGHAAERIVDIIGRDA